MRNLPIVGPDWKQWAQSLSRALSRSTQLDALETGASAAEDGILLWDRSSLNVVVSKSGAFVALSGGGGATNLGYTAATRVLTSSTGTGVTLPLVATDPGLMLAADKTKLDGIASGATAYVHPNHSGDVTSVGDGATTIVAGAVTLAKQANMATASVVYRKTAAAGAPEVQTLATLKTDLGLTGTNSGDQTITLTGDVTGTGTGSFAATIAADAVTNAKLANIATATIKGRVTAATGDPEDLTTAQATTLIDVVTSALKGLAPASGGGTVNFLRADATWAAPPAGGGTSGAAVVTVTTNGAFEWSETVAAVGVTAGQRIMVSIASHADTDENSAETLDINTMSGTALAAQITFEMSFREPTSGPIRLNWSAA